MCKFVCGMINKWFFNWKIWNKVQYMNFQLLQNYLKTLSRWIQRLFNICGKMVCSLVNNLQHSFCFYTWACAIFIINSDKLAIRVYTHGRKNLLGNLHSISNLHKFAPQTTHNLKLTLRKLTNRVYVRFCDFIWVLQFMHF